MKRLLAAAAIAFAGLFAAGTPAAQANGCYICTSGSSCQQCRYGRQDNAAERKKCREAGCKIGGTRSCAAAANVRTCRASLDAPGWRHAAIEDLLAPAR